VPAATPSSPSRGNSINVLAKAGAVLDALAESGELTAAELADRISEPRSSVYRLLSSLEELGFVGPGIQRGHVRLGAKLFRLGAASLRTRGLRENALPQMLELRRLTGHTIFLGVRDDHSLLCIERIEGLTLVNNTLRAGTSGPLHVGAMGKLLLSVEPDSFVDEVIERGLDSFTPFTPATAAELRADLEEIRRTGISISDQDRLVGMGGIGAGIRDHSGAIVAAISLSGMRTDVLDEHEHENGELVRAAAHAVSQELGYSPGA